MLGLNFGLGNARKAGTTAPAPATLPTIFWFDASDDTTIVQLSGSVSQWNDKSSNGLNLTQTTGANQPSYGARFINGLKALDFDGTNDAMNFPAGAYSIATGNNTFLMVMKSDNATKATIPIIGNYSGGDNGYTINFNESSGTQFQFKQGNTLFATQSITTNVMIFGFRRTAAQLEVFYNGNLLGTASDAASRTLTSLTLGANGGGRQIDGLVGEIVGCNQSLSNTNINFLGNYLAGKWGATWTGI